MAYYHISSQSSPLQEEHCARHHTAQGYHSLQLNAKLESAAGDANGKGIIPIGGKLKNSREEQWRQLSRCTRCEFGVHVLVGWPEQRRQDRRQERLLYHIILIDDWPPFWLIRFRIIMTFTKCIQCAISGRWPDWIFHRYLIAHAR
jgi:hypothetical protein